MKIEKVLVVGCGTMGGQIAMQTALCGYQVCAYDLKPEVVQRAKAILKELEAENGVQYVAARRESDQMTLGALGEGEVLDAIRRCQPDTLTPIEAMSHIYEWKQKLQ